MSSQTVLPAKPEPGGWKFPHIDNRYIPPAFITCILLVGNISFGMLESYQKTLLAIVTAIATEMVLGQIFYWPYALCAAISIMSKYVLRVKGRHIWNPSNFGISALLFIAPDAVATLSIQWGNYLLPMVVIWILGAVIISRAHRFNITATYVLSFIGFAFLRSWLTGSPWQSEIAPLTGPMYQLFIFFMITDPKTTVKSKKWQCVVAFCVALAEMIMRMRQIVYAPFYALFIVGPIAMLIEIWWESRRQSAVGAVAAA
jgi:Na+-transporting NADH:ubiquinone oxidoreductase subunit NqrB